MHPCGFKVPFCTVPVCIPGICHRSRSTSHLGALASSCLEKHRFNALDPWHSFLSTFFRFIRIYIYPCPPPEKVFHERPHYWSLHHHPSTSPPHYHPDFASARPISLHALVSFCILSVFLICTLLLCLLAARLSPVYVRCWLVSRHNIYIHTLVHSYAVSGKPPKTSIGPPATSVATHLEPHRSNKEPALLPAHLFLPSGL